jgi:hypothetical protein
MTGEFNPFSPPFTKIKALVTQTPQRHLKRCISQPLAIVAAFTLFVFVAPCRADPPSLEVVTSWGGPVMDVHVEGNTAFVAVGRRLVVLDIANPGAITEIGSIDVQSAAVSLEVRDDVAFVATQDRTLYGLCSIDISDPTRMAVIDTFVQADLPLQESYKGGPIALYGQYVLLDSADELLAIDATNPAAMTFAGSILGNNFIEEYQLQDSLLFTLHGPQSGDLKIWNLAGGVINPPLVGSLTFPYGGMNTNHQLAVSGDYAYVSLGEDSAGPSTDRLLVIDITNPASPILKDDSFTGLGGAPWAEDIAAANGHVYLTDYVDPSSLQLINNSLGLAILNANDPKAPVMVSNYKPHGNVRGVRIIGDRAFVFDDGEGLIILDVSSPANPVRLGNYYSPALLREARKVRNLLYVVDVWNGFTVLDVSDPSQTPQVVGVYQAAQGVSPDWPGVNCWDVAIQDNLAYFTAGYGGLQVVDVANPANPVMIGQYLPSTECPFSHVRAIQVSGPIAYVGFECVGWLRTLDVSNPAAISVLDGVEYPVARGPWSIATDLSGHVFFGQHGGLATLDASDPQNLTVLQHVSPGVPGETKSTDVALEGTLLFVVSSNSYPSDGMFIRDVTNPASHVALSYTQILGASCVAVQGDRAYVHGIVNNFPGLHLYDVTNPSSSVLLNSIGVGIPGHHSSEGPREDILVDEPYVYLTTQLNGLSDARSTEGLVVLRVNGLPVPCPADINGNGTVNIDDLLAVINAWGPCIGCAADINQNGVVNIDDLLAVISAWGPCK